MSERFSQRYPIRASSLPQLPMPPAIRQYTKAVPKLLELSWRDRRDLLSAQVRLLLAQIRVWTRAKGQLMGTGAGADENMTSRTSARLHEARRLALAIGRASEFGIFRPACLVRSIALCRMLESHGISGGRVQLGVILRDGRLTAHAWVEYLGEVLGDDLGNVSGYERLPGLSVIDAKLNRPF